MTNDEMETRLRDFVAWVRIRRELNPNASIDPETLDVIARGAERQLDGKTPWPKRQGNKPNPDLMWRCYWLVRWYEDERLPQHKEAGGAYAIAATQLSKSADTVEQHVRNAEERMATPEGRADFCLWVAKEKGATMVKFTPASSQNGAK